MNIIGAILRWLVVRLLKVGMENAHICKRCATIYWGGFSAEYCSETCAGKERP